MLSHELIHCLTNSVNLRMKNDADGKTASYIDVQGDLVSYFRFDESKSLGAKNRFSVGNLIAEFSAENYAIKALGNQSFSTFYALLRSTGEKLPQLVGEAVFRKAVLGMIPWLTGKSLRQPNCCKSSTPRRISWTKRTKTLRACRPHKATHCSVHR